MELPGCMYSPLRGFRLIRSKAHHLNVSHCPLRFSFRPAYLCFHRQIFCISYICCCRRCVCVCVFYMLMYIVLILTFLIFGKNLSFFLFLNLRSSLSHTLSLSLFIYSYLSLSAICLKIGHTVNSQISMIARLSVYACVFEFARLCVCVCFM